MRELQEGVIIHIGGANAEDLGKILQQFCENFWRTVEARCLEGVQQQLECLVA
jgi:hypothetical protein